MNQIVITQNISTVETRAVKQAIALADKNDFTCRSISYEELPLYQDVLFMGAMPVGSVEFVRAAMRLAELREPDINPYPPEITIGRKIEKIQSGDIMNLSSAKFIKPCEVKKFSGFIFDKNKALCDYDSYDFEQLLVLLKMDKTEQIYVSDVFDHQIESEWRYYIQDGRCVGFSRYDTNDDPITFAPDYNLIQDSVASMRYEHPFVLDFAVLCNGQTVFVEYNDAWAIGLYGYALSPREYLNFLLARWKKMDRNNG